MFCSNCGKTISEQENHCPACGCPLGEGSFFGSEYTSVQMHIAPNQYEQVRKVRVQGVRPVDDESEKKNAQATGEDYGETTAAQADEYDEQETANVEYDRDQLSEAALESLEEVEGVALEEEMDTDSFVPQEIAEREAEGLPEDVHELIARLDGRGEPKAKTKTRKIPGISLPFGKKKNAAEEAPAEEYADEEYAEEEYYEDGEYADEEYYGEEYEDGEYAEQDESIVADVADDDAEYDAEEAYDEEAEIAEIAGDEDEYSEEDYAEEDYAEEEEPEDGEYEEEEYAEDEYGDEEYEEGDYDEYEEGDYDEYDEYEEEEEGGRRPLNFKLIGIIAGAVVALIVIVVIVMSLFKGGSGSAIEGVDKTLYTQGIALLKQHRDQNHITNITTMANGDAGALNTALLSSANEINALQPETPTENELLFISALQKVETDIANSIATDVLTNSAPGESSVSQQNWQTVDNAISMLEVAKSGDALNAIISGVVVTKAELEATPTPEPAVNNDMLSKGDSGEAVQKLQDRLYELGYLTGGRDGTYGGKTQTAVKLFQQSNGLTVTGVADSETLELVYSDNAKKTEYAPG